MYWWCLPYSFFYQICGYQFLLSFGNCKGIWKYLDFSFKFVDDDIIWAFRHFQVEKVMRLTFWYRCRFVNNWWPCLDGLVFFNVDWCHRIKLLVFDIWRVFSQWIIVWVVWVKREIRGNFNFFPRIGSSAWMTALMNNFIISQGYYNEQSIRSQLNLYMLHSFIKYDLLFDGIKLKIFPYLNSCNSVNWKLSNPTRFF